MKLTPMFAETIYNDSPGDIPRDHSARLRRAE